MSDQSLLEGYHTREAVRDALGVSDRQMRRVLNEVRDRLPHVRIGRRVFIRDADLKAWLDRHLTPTMDKLSIVPRRA